MTERHLGTLVDDANSALKVLESLCQSFRAVEEQTSSFKAQCDDLITEQERLQRLADEVGTDLHYYAYLDNVTRRLNAPGAGRLVDGDAFGEVLTNLDSCIEFMTKNVGLLIRGITVGMAINTSTASLSRRRILPCAIPVFTDQGSAPP